ncbi:hypothetical protein ACLB2K_002674 [Fragaria x ananassa]
MWFCGWWDDHGCSYDLLPSQLQNAVTKFTTVMTFSDYEKRFSPTLQFMAKYKIPWILKWQYNIEPEGYMSAPPISQLTSQTPQLPSSSKKTIQSPSSSQKKKVSSSSSSKAEESSSQKKKASSSSSSKAEELKALAKQLLQEAANLSTDDDEEHSQSESSSHSSPSQPKRWADYDDSQDPYAEFD